MDKGKEVVSRLSKKELKDHGRNAIIAALSTLPAVGGGACNSTVRVPPRLEGKADTGVHSRTEGQV